MIFKIRQVYKAKVHSFKASNAYPTHNLLWIDSLEGSPVFVVEDMKKVCIIIDVLNI